MQPNSTDLLQALEADRVLYIEQVKRLGVQPTKALLLDLNIHTFTATVPRSRYHKTPLTGRFLSLQRRGRLTGSQIGHLVGTAEIRHQLGAQPHEWTCDAAALGATHKPDAVWIFKEQVFAVEYDAGHYASSTILEKARLFSQGYQGIIWGCPSQKRVQNLEHMFQGRVQLVCCEWW